MAKRTSSEIKSTAINERTKLFLWGKSAGRCEMCNKLLYVDSKYGETANFAETVHIHGVGMNGHKERMSPINN